jgi:hemerythrin
MIENLINWNEMYSVGHPMMDEQHQQLISIINKLFNAFKEGNAVESVSSILDEMIRYADLHFISEETLLKENSYPNFDEHLACHAAYKQKIQEFRNKLDEGVVNVHYEIIEYLKNWWNNHILKEDMKYSEFLNTSE